MLHRRWDNLYVAIVGYDAKGTETGYVEFYADALSFTTVDLRPLGTVRSMLVYTAIEDGVTTRATGPGCDIGENAQLIVSSFTYQGAKATTKPAPKMYTKSQASLPPAFQKFADRSS